MKPNTTASQHEIVDLPRLGRRWEIAAIVVALVIVAGSGFFAGFVSAGGAIPGVLQSQQGNEDFDVFWEAWNYIEDEYYYETPSEQDRTYGAIRGMLSTLGDEYTAFVQPSIAALERGNMNGAFGGIGAYVGIDDMGQFTISYPFPGHPAAQAGLKAGDVVLSVDGTSLVGLTLAEGTTLIRGPLGTTVHLEVYRQETGEELSFDVERAEIEIPTVYGTMLDDGVAYVSLLRFNGVATAQVEAEIKLLLDDDPRALVFDLRSNPGGLLPEAISVSDLFLPEGLVATQRTALHADPRLFFSDNGDIAEDIPLVLLIDGGSASASEIVAGAIKDRDRGVLVGTTTYGKGSVQLVHELSDGSQLRVTYGAWYTPEEIPLDGAGISPDIEVTEIDADTQEEDPWIAAALEYINETYPLENGE